ncbi:MAG: DUF2779 domain-containing protein [Methylotenera sp.]|nr:DUF2779 domain-containing protein [Methylotenera sp.]
MKTRYLTKSRFKLAIECPTKLYYSGKPDEYRDAMSEDAFMAMLAEGGYQVGELAKARYPLGIEVAGFNHQKVAQQTQEYLQQDQVVLFEPAIMVGSYFVRIDILVKNGNHFELIEVKAKSYDSMNPDIESKRGGISSSMLPYIQDVAFQKWVLQQAYPTAEISTYLMMLDKAKTTDVNGVNQIFKINGRSNIEVHNPKHVDLQQLAGTLLNKVSVDQYVEQVISNPIVFSGGEDFIQNIAPTFATAYQSNQRIAPAIGAQCGGCQYKTSFDDQLKSGFHECWQQALGWKPEDFDGGTVLDIWNFRKKQQLIDQGVHKISQVQRDNLGEFDDEAGVEGLNRMQRQWLQINGIPSEMNRGSYYFDQALGQVEMSKWHYPYHLIDFETSAVALPFHAGMRPYEAVAFQFSHHVMESDGSVRHAGEFLCVEPGVFPNYAFARALKAELDQDCGTVFMWSHHENTILSAIVEQLAHDKNPPKDAEDLIKFLKTLIKGGERVMFDLCTFAEKAFFYPDTKGSNSIKKVLPAMLKVSQKLISTYSQPIYGKPNGIVSLNFASADGFTWLSKEADGSVLDPYAKLKIHASTLLPDNVATDSSVIADGGAAATAYARLQFESLDGETRSRIKASLLRYCELDTFAMVMIVQGWQADCHL